MEDGSVSSLHCELSVSEFGVRVRDLGSTNGTFIDGAPVTNAEIKHQQTLSLGSVHLRLDHPPAHIAVPSLPPAEQSGPKLLPDGRAACENHLDQPATRRCVKCGRTFCEACLHVLRLDTGAGRVSCPACSGACAALAEPEPAPKAARGLRGMIDTIRVRFIPPQRK